MHSVFASLLISIGLAAVGVIGDTCIRIAGATHKTNYPLVIFGALIYAATAFGWLYVMRHIKFSTIGVYYGVSSLFILALVGVVGFREQLNGYEILGVILAIISMFLLGRFA